MGNLTDQDSTAKTPAFQERSRLIEEAVERGEDFREFKERRLPEYLRKAAMYDVRVEFENGKIGWQSIFAVDKTDAASYLNELFGYYPAYRGLKIKRLISVEQVSVDF